MNRPSPKEIARARQVLADERKAKRKDRGARVKHERAKPPQKSTEDADYMAWLHEGLPCIACLVLGPGGGPIEAAHQKLQRADRGWHRRAGRRGPHRTCVPLCRSHHHEGPVCCDPAQAKFWELIGLGVDGAIDFAEALYGAFASGGDGLPIIQEFAATAASQRFGNHAIGRGM